MALNTVDKASLRQALLTQRRNTPKPIRDAVNQGICSHVLQSKPYRTAKTVFIYWATGDEIDTHAIIADAFKQGKQVCVPKCLPQHRMQPRRIFSEADLTEQTFGIPEPGAHCKAIPLQEIDLCIIPALACDLTGARLGYGGGFYDRFLPATPAYRMVLCAQERILPKVPVYAHDIRCDCIVTEQEVVLIHEG